jgi:hypothetical protein
MSDLAEQESRVPPLLRDRSGVQRVTNIELFFDLVYVFAVTQLSHYLIGHSTMAGALQTGLLLAMVWLAAPPRGSPDQPAAALSNTHPGIGLLACGRCCPQC